MDAPTNSPVRFGVFELDARAGELRRSGHRVALQPQPLEILRALIERPGQVVTREELRRRLWTNGAYVDFDRSLNKAIVKLRDALGDDADSPRYIETLPRRGYRFIPLPQEHAHVDAGIAATEADAVSSPSAAPPVPHSAPCALGSRGWIGGALIILVALAGTWAISHYRGASKPAALTSSGTPPAIHSQVVLPLEILSGDKEQEYLADGMTDTLITELAQIGSLRVISRTSAMHTEDIVSVFLGQGDGSFHSRVTYATGRLPGSLAIADFNGDAKQDIAMVTCSTSGSCLTNALSFLFGNGDGTFQPHVDQDLGVAAEALVVADFNLDASPDLAITTGVDSESAAVSIFLGKGDGAFEPPLQYAIGGVAFHLAAGDFSGDGKQDLAVMRDDVLTLLLGNGDGSFQREKEYIIASGNSAEADFNADGKTDLIVAGGTGTYFAPVLLNIANAQAFTLAVTKAGTGTGTVTIDPGLVTCMPSCSRKFGDGATVTLVAHPDAASSFTGWSAVGCSGTGTCSLTLTSDQTVTATFDLTSRRP